MDCHKFVNCWDSTAILQTCHPANLVFDPESGRCKWSWESGTYAFSVKSKIFQKFWKMFLFVKSNYSVFRKMFFSVKLKGMAQRCQSVRSPAPTTPRPTRTTTSRPNPSRRPQMKQTNFNSPNCVSFQHLGKKSVFSRISPKRKKGK